MIYVANITTPKDTAKTNLKRTELHVTKGLVYKVEFYFPSGSAGLMGVAVFDGLYQVWPSSAGEFFVGESHVVSFDDLYLLESAPFEFQCYTYNTDDTHSHFVSVRIGLVSSDVFLARFLPSKGAEYMVKLRRQLREERMSIARLQTQQRIGIPLERLPWEKEEPLPPPEPEPEPPPEPKPKPEPVPEPEKPVKILTFWEWAKTKGITYSSPFTRERYGKYVKAAEGGLVPEPTSEPEPEPALAPEPVLPAKILTFWEWAATKGISFDSPFTRKDYEDYVKAVEGGPVK